MEKPRPRYCEPCRKRLVNRYLSDALTIRSVVLNYVLFVVRLLTEVLNQLFWRVDRIRNMAVVLLTLPQND